MVLYIHVVPRGGGPGHWLWHTFPRLSSGGVSRSGLRERLPMFRPAARCRWCRCGWWWCFLQQLQSSGVNSRRRCAERRWPAHVGGRGDWCEEERSRLEARLSRIRLEEGGREGGREGGNGLDNCRKMCEVVPFLRTRHNYDYTPATYCTCTCIYVPYRR